MTLIHPEVQYTTQLNEQVSEVISKTKPWQATLFLLLCAKRILAGPYGTNYRKGLTFITRTSNNRKIPTKEKKILLSDRLNEDST